MFDCNFTRRGSYAIRFETLEQRQMLSAAPVGGELLINDFVVREQTAENAAMAVASASGATIVVFEGKGLQDRQGVFAEVLDADGRAVTSSLRVNTTIRGDQYAPTVAASEEGAFIVAWAGRGGGDKQGVFFQRFSAAGVAISGETLVNETVGGKQAAPDIAMASDGSFVVVWSGVGSGDVSGVFLRRFDADGEPLAGELLVNTETTDHQSAPSITFESSGNLVVTWQSRHQDGSDWGVYGQWYAPDGSSVGGEVRLSETSAASQSAPTVTDDPTAGVVVGWQSRGQDGDSWGVVAREFDANGNATSAEVLLNDQTAGHQQEVAIAVADDGQWLSAWTSGVPDGSGLEVIVRSFEPDGAGGTAERVNQETGGASSGHQLAPAVAAAGARAFIVWSGNGADDHRGVYGQGYSIDLGNGVQQSPQLALIEDHAGEVGESLEIIVTATDPNLFDTLTFLLDVDNSPADAVLEQINNNTARVLWTPPASALGQDVLFRLLVIDDGEPPLADSEDFFITVNETSQETATAESAVDAVFTDLS